MQIIGYRLRLGSQILKSIENYIDYGVGIDFKPPKLKTKKLETIESVLEK